MRSTVLAVLVFAASRLTLTAQTSQTDRRWLPWLGCWQADASTGEQSTSASATCIVPISGSPSVEMLTVARHKVVARDRLDPSGRPHTIDGQGCDGMEVVHWSTTGHRALIRSDYVCTSGIKGFTATIFAMTSTGEWLRVEEVRSGEGSTLTISRLHDIGLLSVVTSEAQRSIDEQRRTIIAARAAAAAPITSAEVAEASNTLNESVVRAWVLSSDERMDLDARQIAALSANELAPVYTVAPALPQNTGNVYVSSSVYAPETASPFDGNGYPCFALSTLNCALSPFSTFNGLGVPLGFAVTRNSGFRGKDGHGSRGHNSGPFVGRPFGGRPFIGRPFTGRPGGVRPVGVR